MNLKISALLLLFFIGGCASAPRQPIYLDIKAVFTSPRQVNVIKCKPENVTGFYVPKKKTIVITMPTDWQDFWVIETIGHEILEVFFDHEEEWWLPGKGKFLMEGSSRRKTIREIKKNVP